MNHVSYKVCITCTIHLYRVDGNTDGVMKGKRYFKCPSKHGRFVRITNILSVLPSRVSLKFLDIVFIVKVPGHVLSSASGPSKTTRRVQNSNNWGQYKLQQI